MRRVDGEGRSLGIRLRAPSDLGVDARRLDANHLCRFARKADRHAGVGLSGKGPAHRPVEGVGDQIGARAIGLRHKVVEVGELVLVHHAGRVGVADDQWRLEVADGLPQQGVLVILGGLVEQNVKADRFGALLLERLEQIGEEGSIDRRAIRELRHRLLGDGGDDDVLGLRHRRLQRSDADIGRDVLEAGQEGEVLGGCRCQCRRQHRYAQSRSEFFEFLLADHGPEGVAGVLPSFRMRASACWTQPFCSIQLVSTKSLSMSRGTVVILMACSCLSTLTMKAF